MGAVHVAGNNVLTGRDWTLFATADGIVKFESGRRVSVYPPAKAAVAKPTTAPAAAK